MGLEHLSDQELDQLEQAYRIGNLSKIPDATLDQALYPGDINSLSAKASNIASGFITGAVEGAQNVNKSLAGLGALGNKALGVTKAMVTSPLTAGGPEKVAQDIQNGSIKPLNLLPSTPGQVGAQEALMAVSEGAGPLLNAANEASGGALGRAGTGMLKLAAGTKAGQALSSIATDTATSAAGALSNLQGRSATWFANSGMKEFLGKLGLVGGDEGQALIAKKLGAMDPEASAEALDAFSKDTVKKLEDVNKYKEDIQQAFADRQEARATYMAHTDLRNMYQMKYRDAMAKYANSMQEVQQARANYMPWQDKATEGLDAYNEATKHQEALFKHQDQFQEAARAFNEADNKYQSLASGIPDVPTAQDAIVARQWLSAKRKAPPTLAEKLGMVKPPARAGESMIEDQLNLLDNHIGGEIDAQIRATGQPISGDAGPIGKISSWQDALDAGHRARTYDTAGTLLPSGSMGERLSRAGITSVGFKTLSAAIGYGPAGIIVSAAQSPAVLRTLIQTGQATPTMLKAAALAVPELAPRLNYLGDADHTASNINSVGTQEESSKPNKPKKK